MARKFKLYHKNILVFCCADRSTLKQAFRLYYAVGKSAYLNDYDFIFKGMENSLVTGLNYYHINEDLKLVFK